MSRILCFKPMRKVHESGYRYIQYGYITEGEDGGEHIEIVGQYDILQLPYDTPIPCNIDLTRSGWFRILPRLDAELEWSYSGEIKKLAQPNNL